jgi:hypothetical protein
MQQQIRDATAKMEESLSKELAIYENAVQEAMTRYEQRMMEINNLYQMELTAAVNGKSVEEMYG